MNIPKLIKKLYFYNKISYLFVIGKKAKSAEYSKDYDIISKTYQNLWIKKMGTYTREMLTKLHFSEGYSLLDLACGTGFIIEEALKKANPSEILGIDNSKKMLDVAKSRIKSKKVKFICEDMLNALKKIPSNSFDIVTCGWAFAYVDSNRLLKQIHRVLKPNGQVGIIVNRKKTIKNIEDSFLELMEGLPTKIDMVNDIKFKLPRGATHLEKMFKKNGFKYINGYDKEQSFNFKDGIDAVTWVKECGAIAGTFKILNIKYFIKPLAQVLEKRHMKNNRITVTHKFSVAMGKKC